ncbi:hypothetical protein O4H49_20490 [Kiloniella laminariae]|uniref:Uncharacterized protein n=1 Tax=Kiloniella laminariae TaxID=454162 RepID=A0ABT4LPW7_9PROT|nr:hypothetical protein [Kiloniella laminariae]MCZ4283168.1 hypothetical protein [Kiloniella laminariae]
MKTQVYLSDPPPEGYTSWPEWDDDEVCSVLAEEVADVGGDLTLASVRDTSRIDGNSKGGSLGLSTGLEGSGDTSRDPPLRAELPSMVPSPTAKKRVARRGSRNSLP